jgi:hypothetical protein
MAVGALERRGPLNGAHGTLARILLCGHWLNIQGLGPRERQVDEKFCKCIVRFVVDWLGGFAVSCGSVETYSELEKFILFDSMLYLDLGQLS